MVLPEIDIRKVELDKVDYLEDDNIINLALATEGGGTFIRRRNSGQARDGF